MTRREALMQGQRKWRRELRDGNYTGPLAGVPVAVKDNICIQGKPTTCAFKDSLEDFVPPYHGRGD